MTDQNSGVDYQIRPEDLQEELGIKKDAYYAYVKFLSLKIEKSEGKAFLSGEQANLLRSLRSHVVETGKMEGFVNTNGGELATFESGNLSDQVTQPVEEIPIAEDDNQLNELIRAASELAAQRIAMPQMVVGELSKRIGYEDLPADLKEKVDQVRENAIPKQNPAQLAEQLLARYRQKAVTA
jgi:hypothetical protein